MLTCSNCGKPATMFRLTSGGEVPTCDSCRPGDWTGDARPLVKELPDLSGRLTLNRDEAADMLGVSLDTFRDRIEVDLRVIHRGRRILIPTAELKRWVEDSAARARRDGR